MKISFDEYKKYFTLEEIEKVKVHKKEIEPEEISGILDVLRGYREELKIKLTWSCKRDYPENTYFGDGIEISVEAWYYDQYKNEVQHIHTGLWNICQICNADDRNKCGYIRTFCENR